MFTRRTKSLASVPTPIGAIHSPRSEQAVLLSSRQSFLRTTGSSANPCLSPQAFSKGLKLLYDLFPTDNPGSDGSQTVQKDQGNTKGTDRLLTPVRLSYLQARRKSLKSGDNADLIAQLTRLFGKQNNEIAPLGTKLSDVEKLSLEAKIKRRKVIRKKSLDAQICLSPRINEKCSSQTPLPTDQQKPSAVLSPRHLSRPPILPSNPAKTIVVSLPQLPFGHHKSYNDEADFIRTHLYHLNLDGSGSEHEGKNRQIRRSIS